MHICVRSTTTSAANDGSGWGTPDLISTARENEKCESEQDERKTGEKGKDEEGEEGAIAHDEDANTHLCIEVDRDVRRQNNRKVQTLPLGRAALFTRNDTVAVSLA